MAIKPFTHKMDNAARQTASCPIDNAISMSAQSVFRRIKLTWRSIMDISVSHTVRWRLKICRLTCISFHCSAGSRSETCRHPRGGRSELQHSRLFWVIVSTVMCLTWLTTETPPVHPGFCDVNRHYPWKYCSLLQKNWHRVC